MHIVPEPVRIANISHLNNGTARYTVSKKHGNENELFSFSDDRNSFSIGDTVFVVVMSEEEMDNFDWESLEEEEEEETPNIEMVRVPNEKAV